MERGGKGQVREGVGKTLKGGTEKSKTSLPGREELWPGVQFEVLVQRNTGCAPNLPQKQGGLHNQNWVLGGLTTYKI